MYYYGNLSEDNYPQKIQITKGEFNQFVSDDIIPPKAIDSDNLYYLSENKSILEVTNSDVFILYNQKQSFYYLFKFD